MALHPRVHPRAPSLPTRTRQSPAPRRAPAAPVCTPSALRDSRLPGRPAFGARRTLRGARQRRGREGPFGRVPHRGRPPRGPGRACEPGWARVPTLSLANQRPRPALAHGSANGRRRRPALAPSSANRRRGHTPRSRPGYGRKRRQRALLDQPMGGGDPPSLPARPMGGRSRPVPGAVTYVSAPGPGNPRVRRRAPRPPWRPSGRGGGEKWLRPSFPPSLFLLVWGSPG